MGHHTVRKMEIWILLITVTGLVPRTWCRFDQRVVQIDLQRGVVRGYSPYISFITSPTLTRTGACDSQAVVKVDFSGPYKGAELTVHYGKSPRLWTLDISDSKTGDGYGGDDNTTSNMAELQILNRQMRIYGNILPGYMDASRDGGLLIKTIDGFATKGSKAVINISDERIEWSRGKIKDYLQSKFLYTLNGQKTLYGDVDYDVYFGFNRVVAGNYRNGSGLCSANIRLISFPGNECAKGTLKCHPDANCIDSVRSSRCKCKPGFFGDGFDCRDYNECAYKNGGCTHFCHNTKGNYTCDCREGFELDKSGKNCIDMNECFVDKGGCQQQCKNTIGGYECRCNQGYALDLDERTCKVTNWCQKHLGCEHLCRSTTQGSVTCYCRDGFTLHQNGKSCIQTCKVFNGGCQHNCSDTRHGVKCSCAVDYILTDDNSTCIASCNVSHGGCHSRKYCNDTNNGPICSCPIGYKLHQDQKTCLDIDECLVDNGGCGDECVNVNGWYECTCPMGYKLKADQKTCEDIDECELNTTCDHICKNTPGSYECACRPGYATYGISHCADKDECSNNHGGCQQECSNSAGGYECLCNKGYKLHNNEKDCIANTTCYELSTPPGSDLSCRKDGDDMLCVHRCETGNSFTTATGADQPVMTTHCGPGTQYKWSHETQGQNLPSCSSSVISPKLSRRVIFNFLSIKCKKRKSIKMKLARNITQTLNSQKKYKCESDCHIPEPVNLKCKKMRFKKGQIRQYNITVEFDLMRTLPGKIKKNCDVKCEMKKMERKLKKVVKKLRKAIKKQEFKFSYLGEVYTAGKKWKAPRGTQLWCEDDRILVGDSCVGCARGSFYHRTRKVCTYCPPSYYQDVEAESRCKICPGNPPGIGIHGAASLDDCTVQCQPGYYSSHGSKPCQPCPVGSYQPEFGRTSCQRCPRGLRTSQVAATSFSHCQATDTCVKDHFYDVDHRRCQPCPQGTYQPEGDTCVAGHFYDVDRRRCQPCPQGTYQPEGGQNFCVSCPAMTTTDQEGSTDTTDCKSHECGKVFDSSVLHGVIESPNYPGDYPANISCVWKIRPRRNRRILVIIPSIDLRKADKCGDKLVMRKSKNAYSTVTFETCEKGDGPITFTARSKRLWIQFQSDGSGTAKGFSIPFVTYLQDYQPLIEDIVEDGRLYTSLQHQSIFKDRKLLNTLMTVIAKPENYLFYQRIYKDVFPESFLKLLKKKVIQFLQH